jgi:MFS family permease
MHLNHSLINSQQSLLMVIVQTLIVHVPITIITLGGLTTLAGLGVSLMWGGWPATTYHIGRLMDRIGRMPIIMAGLLLIVVAALWLN